MIHQTVAYLNGLLEVLGVASNYYGITELEEDRDKDDNVRVIPMVYVSRGNSDEVDFESKAVYHRITGTVTREESEDITTKGCGLGIVQTAPMKLVCFFDKNIYNTDDANITFKVGNNIANTISSENIKSLATSLQVDYVNVRVDGINTDRRSIFGEEFDGIEYDLPSDLGLVSIDYTIEVAGDESCFVSYGCNDEEINIRQLIIDEYCADQTTFMIANYITTASATQTFADFVGYSLENMYVNLQGAGNLGHLAGLSAAKKLITAWDSATGVMTFKTALTAGNQITVIGTL